MPIPEPILDAARLVLARNGIDTRHPSFRTPSGLGAAVNLLDSKSAWGREQCAEVVRALAAEARS